MIITGPNTGGKTSALKTVGLITVMVQSGLLVPVAEGDHCAIFDEVSVDIGDGQSLEHALSTFSAHIRNIRDILQTAGRSTLVLLDEMASGTDPGEGVGLSIAILEELSQRQATVVVTTHFTEIKILPSAPPALRMPAWNLMPTHSSRSIVCGLVKPGTVMPLSLREAGHTGVDHCQIAGNHGSGNGKREHGPYPNG